MTTFDNYSNWMQGRAFGKKAVLDSYNRTFSNDEASAFDKNDRKRLKDNLLQNIVSIVEENPNVQFYMFIPPYSICWFDEHIKDGSMQELFSAMEYEIELLTPYKNVHLFSFFDAYDVVLDLDNYCDNGHYGEWVNSQILQWMNNGEHQLTSENFKLFCSQVKDFYLNYDYDTILKNN